MRKVIPGIILLCAFQIAIAHDQMPDQKGWQVGAGMGSANLHIEPVSDLALESNKEDVMLYTIFGGYKFNNWFGLEFDISQTESFTDVNTELSANVTGLSFAPKFSLHLVDNLEIYLLTGLQYIAYDQTVDSYYDDELTWNDISPFIGTGLQYNFNSGVTIRINYRQSRLTLDRSDGRIFGYNLYSDEIDLTYKALTLTVNYQF